MVLQVALLTWYAIVSKEVEVRPEKAVLPEALHVIPIVHLQSSRKVASAELKVWHG